MKKLLVIAIAAFALAACEGPMGPQGPQGPQGQPGYDGRDGQDGNGANWSSFSITVSPEDWEVVDGSGKRANPGDLNTMFVAYKQLPALTRYIYDYGSVIAYIKTGDGVKNGMPFVVHLGEATKDGGAYLWTETYDFDFMVGEIGFYLTFSDFETTLRPEQPKTFHVVMLWP